MHRRFASTIRLLAMTGAAFWTFHAYAQDVTPPRVLSVDELDRHLIKVQAPERIGPGLYRIGDISLNRTDLSISFPAVVNMDKGLLEYVLVRQGGKTHESLLRTTIEPYNLQIACLLLGMEGTGKPLGFQGDPRVPGGDSVDIVLQYNDVDGKQAAVKPEQWVVQTAGETRQDAPPGKWVYTGSMVRNGRFAAQVSGSIAAIYHDPMAMYDNAAPGGENDKIWFVKEEAVPPVGTPVTVTIRVKR